MHNRGGGLVSWGDTATALVVAHLRYWLTVAPWVRYELRRWRRRVRAIEDPLLRAHAAKKLSEERANTHGTATLCTLAPRRYRRSVVAAAVALQVMYDYLDAVTEQPVPDHLRSSRQLFQAFAIALTPGAEPVDYYRYHPQWRDGGYLNALVGTCRTSIEGLPGGAAVLPIARTVVQRFSEAQSRSHVVPHEGVAQLERWAVRELAPSSLTWWEWAGGAAASIFAIHALLSAAADPRTTRHQAVQIDKVYLLSSALATMLDSLVDDERDAAHSNHRYISYYATPSNAAGRLATVAREAAVAARELPNAAHHVMTVAGVTAFYLSAPTATTGEARAVATPVTNELRPIIVPILATLRIWRRVTRNSSAGV
jgi:tetraprenyl-beta-curcumene synthase